MFLLGKLLILLIFGVCFGSFINVVRYRFSYQESLLFPNSYCDNCKKRLYWHQNIPIISWLVLGGRCKFCNYKIPTSYPLIEIIVGMIFVLNNFSKNYFFQNSPNANLILLCIFSFFLIAISLIDLDHLVIPNSLTLSLLICSIPMLLVMQLSEDQNYYFIISRIFQSAISFIVLEFFSNVYYIFFKKIPFGMGDSKLISVFVIWLGIKAVLVSLLLSIYFAGFFIFISLISKKIKYKSKIAFGPFLCLGGYLTLYFGKDFWLEKLFFF